MRKEKDALGEVPVPDEAYWGAQTERARDSFAVGDERWPRPFLRAHALVKQAAAIVNAELTDLDPAIADAIQRAAGAVIDGDFDDQFPLVVWQSGSGTQTNMNMNEVIANRASELLGGRRGEKKPVHPNDHVNRSQSTNDTVPTSMHVAALRETAERLLPALDDLHAALDERSAHFAAIVKIGRTHLQDATPLTLGQEFSGYAAQVDAARAGIAQALEPLRELPIGGTAVGTGLNAPAGFDRRMCEVLADLTGRAFRPARNKFAGQAAHDALVALSGALRTLAVALTKIANDLRLLGSGPRAGLGELKLPVGEPGSSIMPGKVNPTQCEMVTQVCCRVIGNDATVALAGSQGHFELNAYKPVIAHALLQSIRLLGDACASFAARCVAGIEADGARIDANLKRSLMLVTALNPHIGYDRAAEIALKAWREEKTLREAALQLGAVSAEDFDRIVRPEHMLGPR